MPHVRKISSAEWACDLAPDDPIRVAIQYGVRVAVVERWCRERRFPHAVRESDGWHIPPEDQARFVPPARGRPPRSDHRWSWPNQAGSPIHTCRLAKQMLGQGAVAREMPAGWQCPSCGAVKGYDR